MTTALYPGSFDPFTHGHLSILRDAAALFERVVIAVGAHPSKKGLLGAEERALLAEACVRDAGLGNVAVSRFDGLVVDEAKARGATVLVRGVRDGTDLDYELQMIGMNREMDDDLRTVLLPPAARHRHVTGTLVRQIAAMGGNISPFVPAATLAALGLRPT